MPKQISLLGLLALAIVGFILWRDPGGLATTVGHLFGTLGHLLKEAGQKLSTFVGGVSKP